MSIKAALAKGALNLLFYKHKLKPSWSEQEKQAYDELYEELTFNPDQAYTLPQGIKMLSFLYYIQERHELLFHGSTHGEIIQFEPRKQTLFNGVKTEAVFASRDPIWSMFYAILNKQKLSGSIRNACINVKGSQKRYYFFSINQETALKNPWVEGYLYLLPKASFKPAGDGEITFDEWVSEQEVTPLAKLKLFPGDFPFFNKISLHKEQEHIIKSWLLYKLRVILRIKK